MTTTEPYTPRSLRDIVAAGDNPLDHLAPGHDLDSLIDELRLSGVLVTPRGRATEAEQARELLDWMLQERCTPIIWGERRYEGDPDDGPDGFGFARVVQMWRWKVDLLEDPSLVEQVLELLPPAERLAASVAVDQARSPHPLEVRGVMGWDNCDGCGAVMSPGLPVLRIGTRPDYSEDRDIEGLGWCAKCVRAAVAAVAEWEAL